jgi:hypothetical protein
MLGDNMAVAFNTSVPLSVLRIKHDALAYHGVCEAIASKIMRFTYV